jgi:hypothetical protein
MPMRTSGRRARSPTCERARAVTLEKVVADWRERATALRMTDHQHDAELVERVCTDVARAAEDYLTWLPEKQAILQSGHRVEWFRSRRDEWQERGNARRIGRQWEYRELVVPRRIHAEFAYRAGERAADTQGVA